MLYFTQRMAAFCAHATSQPIASKLGAGLVAGGFLTSQLYAASAEAKATTTTTPDLTENDDTPSQASAQVEYANPIHFGLTLADCVTVSYWLIVSYWLTVSYSLTVSYWLTVSYSLTVSQCCSLFFIPRRDPVITLHTGYCFKQQPQSDRDQRQNSVPGKAAVLGWCE